MSGCALRRWGPGTTTERPPNTEAAQKLEGGLAAMLAARQAQDCKYFPAAAASKPAANATHASSQLGGTQMRPRHN